MLAVFLRFLLIFFLASRAQGALEDWIRKETHFSIQRILDHSTLADGLPGAVIASSSQSNPDYYFHWVRDSAISMEALAQVYSITKDPLEKNQIRTLFFDFAKFSRKLQLTPTISGLGEPKFYIDGRPFSLPWGRPQNDGPALRAYVLTHVANLLLDEAEQNNDTAVLHWVKTVLYDSRLPSNSVIKNDLEYISHHWIDPCYDMWEEHFGHHFVTQYAQKVALEYGGHLAERLGDPGAAKWYYQQANNIQLQFPNYWNKQKQFFSRSLEQLDTLDSAFVLVVLHANNDGNPFLGDADDRVFSTLLQIEQGFQQDFPINKVTNSLAGPMASAIGRYFGDTYQGGHAWVLLTLAFSEFYYQLARVYLDSGRIYVTPITQTFLSRLPVNPNGSNTVPNIEVGHTYFKESPQFKSIVRLMLLKGDAFLARVNNSAGESLQLSEQMDKITGAMTSAKDLTWNYARFLFSAKAREEVFKKANSIRTN